MNHRLFKMRGASGPHRKRGDHGKVGGGRVGSLIAKLVVVFAAASLVAAVCGSSSSNSADAQLLAAGKASGSVAPFVYVDNDYFATTRSYNIFNPAFPAQAHYFVVLPLAIRTAQSLTSYIPEVAVSWKLQHRTFTVHIRRNMRWQTGAPVTARDVVTSMILNGVDSGGVWDDITNVTAPTSSEVVFTLAPKVAPQLAESLILPTFIIPAQEYQRFVTPTVSKTVKDYYQAARNNPKIPPSGPVATALTSDLKTLEKFHPSTIIGDGPFRWKAWTTSNALLTKSPTFFDAKNVHIPVFEFDEAPPQVIEGASLHGNASINTAGLPYTFYESYSKQPDQHIYYPPAYVQDALAYNCRKYPLNMVQVRQALTYIIHRPSLNALAYGPHPYTFFRFTSYPALVYSTDLKYLTKTQLDSLNQYRYSTTKATQLLKSVGFHKVHGEWIMPNGKPFTLTTSDESGDPNTLLQYKAIASWLTAFGIKTSEVVVPYASYDTDIQNGNFDIGDIYAGADLDPLQMMSLVLGYANYNLISKTEPGIGFGPTMTVPGIGTVNVPHAITIQANQTGPGKVFKQRLWDWARFINKEVPVLSVGNKYYPLAFSTKYYRHWPSESSPLWSVEAMSQHAGLVAMMEKGYLVPNQ